MGLQFSLLASVAAVMTWVIRTEDGGLLNALFRITSPPGAPEPEFALVSEFDKPVFEFFTDMLLLKPLPLPILQVMPESLGGGQRGVDSAHVNPNRGPDIFWTTIFIFLLIVVFIVLIQIVNFCCCCCKRIAPHGSMNVLQLAALGSDFSNGWLIFRIVHIVALVIALAFLFVSTLLLIVYFHSTGLVVAYLETAPQPSTGRPTSVSLPDGLHSTMLHASSFVRDGIKKGRALTNTTLRGLFDRADAKMHSSVRDTSERLLTYLGMQNVLEKGEMTVQVMKNLSVHVIYASDWVILLHNETASLEAQLATVRTVYAEAFKSIKYCGKRRKCRTLNASIASISSPIPAYKFNIATTRLFFEELLNTITKLSSSLDTVRKTIAEFQNSASDLLNSLKPKLFLSRVLEQTEAFWHETAFQSDKVLRRLDEAVKLVEIQVSTYSKHIQIGFFVVGGIITVMVIIAALITTRLVHQAFEDRLFANLTTVPIDSTNTKSDNIVCGKKAVCCCSTLLIPLLLTFAVIIAVLLFLLTTISSEFCIYLERESAVKQTDFVVSGYLAQEWRVFISRRDISGSASVFNTPPPRRVLYALTQTCNSAATRHPVGLLSALGYDNIIDMHNLVNTSQLTNVIQQGRVAVKQQIRNLNTSKLPATVSKVMEIRRRLNKSLTNFKVTDLTRILNPNDMDAAPFERMLEETKNVIGGNFVKPNEFLSKAIKSVRKIRSQMDKMLEFLKTLDSTKSHFLDPFDELLKALHETRHAVEEDKLMTEALKQYNNLTASLLDYARVDGEKSFKALTASLFPCEEAHAAYNAVIGVTCGEAGGVRLLLGLVYVFALNVLFIILLYFALFNLAFFQALRIRMLSAVG